MTASILIIYFVYIFFHHRYRSCLDEILNSIEEPKDPRDEKIHGALLILNELLCCANNEWERIDRELQPLTCYNAYPPDKKVNYFNSALCK